MWHPKSAEPENICRFDLPKQKLTSRFVETVTVEARTDFLDTQVAGLSLRVAPSSVKTWSLLYTRQGDGEKQRFKLGRSGTHN